MLPKLLLLQKDQMEFVFMMTSCAQANSDQVACSLARDRCSWTPASQNGTTTSITASTCTPRTCQTYQASNYICANFYNWANTLQQICSIQDDACTETDPTTFGEEDFLKQLS